MQKAPGAAPFEPGSMVADRYEIRCLLGKGGMGQVYLAHDRQMERHVAIKTMKRQFTSERDAVSRFEREVTLVRQLDHPGIVKLYETHNWNGILFYTMEYVEGKTLRCLLRERQRLDFPFVADVLRQVCDALAHAHKITIHRDLSPDNIMVLPDGSVRLLDFGLAKLDDRFSGLTLIGSNLGKLKYMAPEQELNAAAVDRRADLYSLGIIFYELLAGHTPAPGKKITRLRPELPRKTEEFMRRVLARKPEERCYSAREFREELQNLLRLYEERRTATAASRLRSFFRDSILFRWLFRTGAKDARRAAQDGKVAGSGSGSGKGTSNSGGGGVI